jgi:hypothetical protein
MNTNLTGRFTPDTATSHSLETRRERLDRLDPATQPPSRTAELVEDRFEVTIELLEFDDGEE